jgi:hypothetical protein
VIERKAIADLIKRSYRRGTWPASDAWARQVTDIVNALDYFRRPPKPKGRHRGSADDARAAIDAVQRYLRERKQRLLPYSEIMRSSYQLADTAEKALKTLLDNDPFTLTGARRRPGRPPSDWYVKAQAVAFFLFLSLKKANRTASFTYRDGPGIGAVVELLKLVGETRSRKAVWDAIRAARADVILARRPRLPGRA